MLNSQRALAIRAGLVAIFISALAWMAVAQSPEPSTGRWFKGNLHTHTVNSDGDSSPDAVARWYKEHDYDFLAMAVAAESDPRFAALDSAEFNTASDRLAEYCGYDIEPPSTGLLPSSGTGSGGGGITTTLPDDFPPELVPPDSVVNFAGNSGPGLAAEFTSTASVEEILAFYEDVLGDVTVRDSESVIWSVFVDDSLKTVTVTGTDGEVSIAVALVGS